jgi:hypothetical protein
MTQRAMLMRPRYMPSRIIALKVRKATAPRSSAESIRAPQRRRRPALLAQQRRQLSRARAASASVVEVARGDAFLQNRDTDRER